jgi:hypothetical protein
MEDIDYNIKVNKIILKGGEWEMVHPLTSFIYTTHLFTGNVKVVGTSRRMLLSPDI